MVIEIIRYNIEAGKEGAFEAAYEEAGRYLGKSPHCLGHQISRCVEEPSHYIARIEWDSLEGHMKGFRGGPDFGRFFALVRPCFDSIEEMRHYEVKLEAS